MAPWKWSFSTRHKAKESLQGCRGEAVGAGGAAWERALGYGDNSLLYREKRFGKEEW